jgi:YHYH protein
MTGIIDITNQIFTKSSGNCADYASSFSSSVQDIQRALAFKGTVLINTTATTCTIMSNAIPNHDFNNIGARFATNVAMNNRSFTITRSPTIANTATPISQGSYNAVMLNGVVLDILSAGCYRPSSPAADEDGNVAVGCSAATEPWLLDPLSTYSRFSTDEHNAHTQPDGTYHYHGNPMAMFDDNPGPLGSPVIGFAADGFPIYGTYFLDNATGQVRKAKSGYTLKQGSRPSSAVDPGGEYNGLYVADYEFTNAGDLDRCNGMTVNGQYGYYVTDSYPWVIKCFSGTPNASFRK